MDVFKPAARQNSEVETFRSSLADVCGQFQVSPAGRRTQLDTHLSVQRNSNLDVAQVGLDADSVERTALDIRRDPGEHFFLILQREGIAYLSQNGIEAQVVPGDMFLVDATKPCKFSYGGAYSLQLSVHLPRDEMQDRFGRRIFGGQKVDRLDPLGLSMRALLAKLCADGAPDQSHVVEAFYSVFGALLTERAQQTNHTANPDRLIVQRALTIIADRFSDHAFTTLHLAELVGVSLRRLQRAFQVIDETPHERLQSYRIAAAHLLLRNSQTNGLRTTVTAIAYDSGFADLSTFYRLYRKVYGRAPGQDLLS